MNDKRTEGEKNTCHEGRKETDRKNKRTALAVHCGKELLD